MISYVLGIGQAAPLPGQGNPLVQFAPFLLILAVFYFLVFRPQSKKMKAQQQMLASLKRGDDVITRGGLIGRISGIKDDEITLQVQEGVRLRILRNAVEGLHRSAGGDTGAKAETKAS